MPVITPDFPTASLSGDSTHDTPTPSLSPHDLRIRTLTYILSALDSRHPTSGTAGLTALQPNPVADNSDKPPDPDDDSASDGTSSTSDGGTSLLKVLNQVALLLVREHEIVAVIPKRSGSDAHVNIMITTDSDSDRDAEEDRPNGHYPGHEDEGWDSHSEEDTTPLEGAYFVTRNPRNHSGHNTPTHSSALRALAVVGTPDEMFTYLNEYPDVSFTTHVTSIELLLTKITPAHHLDPTMAKQLFQLYITFRAAPKMQRRFRSPALKPFFQAVRSLTQKEVTKAIAYNSVEMMTDDSRDLRLIGRILHHHSFPGECPYLFQRYGDFDGQADYNEETCWEYHQLFVYCLEMAAISISKLTSELKSKSQAVAKDTLLDAERWTNYLHKMVHCSPIFQAHVEALDDLISKKIKGHDSPGPGDDDIDGGLSDAELEIRAAQATSRVAQESLWLTVSYQQAMLIVMERTLVANTPISLTLWEPPAPTNQRSTDMEPWESVIQSIYPSTSTTPDEISRTARNQTINASDAIEALKDYGHRNGGKATLFTPDGHQRCFFRGVYHAESMLGTLAYLSCHPTPEPPLTVACHALPADELAQFKNTYGTIGVSKRCCPICTKLLSLFSAPMRGQSCHSYVHPELRVLAAHQNIYPTSLPPFIPTDIARELVEWLEGLVRQAVGKLVRRRRRRPPSVGSASSRGSADSKGHSPRRGDMRNSTGLDGVGDAMEVSTVEAGKRKWEKW